MTCLLPLLTLLPTFILFKKRLKSMAHYGIYGLG